MTYNEVYRHENWVESGRWSTLLKHNSLMNTFRLLVSLCLAWNSKLTVRGSQKRREELERLEKERQAEIRSYKGLMVSEKMTSNKDVAGKGKSLQELEDDFM